MLTRRFFRPFGSGSPEPARRSPQFQSPPRSPCPSLSYGEGAESLDESRVYGRAVFPAAVLSLGVALICAAPRMER